MDTLCLSLHTLLSPRIRLVIPRLSVTALPRTTIRYSLVVLLLIEIFNTFYTSCLNQLKIPLPQQRPLPNTPSLPVFRKGKAKPRGHCGHVRHGINHHQPSDTKESRNGTAHSRVAEYVAQKKTKLLAETMETIQKRFAVFQWNEEEQECSGYLGLDES